MVLENPTVPQAEKLQTEEIKLTPEQIQEKILQEVLEKYGVDLKEYTYDQTKFWLQILKIELETTPEELLIEKKSQELYKDFVDSQLQNWNVEKIVSLESLSQSIDSDRIQSLREELEPILDKWLEKYTFLDGQNKNFIKLGFINSLLKSPVAEIGESLIGGVWKFIGKLSNVDPNNIQSISEALKDNPEDSGRTLALEEEFMKKWGSYTSKFDEIQAKFAKDGITDAKEQQNIISHIDWFRNPVFIEAWAEQLDITKIDISKKEKNTSPLDSKSLSEYMQNSREKIAELSKKLNIWDKTGDVLYGLINEGGTIWNGVQKIVETLLKIPFLWKFLAIFLWLSTDPEKAISELRENGDNFKIFSSFTSLWVSKDKDGKTIEWKEPFKDIDLSGINFNASKKEIQKMKEYFWDTNKDELQTKWQEAFTNGIKKDDLILKFDISKAWEDKKITTKEFKEIINTGLKSFDTTKWETTQKQIEEDKVKVEKEISSINTEKNALSLLSWEPLEWFSQANWLWNLKDFPLSELNGNNSWEEILKKILWEENYKNLSWDIQQSLEKILLIIKDFLKVPESSLYVKDSSSIWDIIGTPVLKTFIENKNIVLAGNEQKLNEQAQKHLLAGKIKETFATHAQSIKLSEWVNIDTTQIIFANNQLKIWNDVFVFSWVKATITDIIIEPNNVIIKGKKWFISWEEILPKDDFITWLQALVVQGSFHIAKENIDIKKA